MLKNQKVAVNRILRDILTDKIEIELETRFRGKTVVKHLQASEFNVRGLQRLTDFGFPFFDRTETESFYQSVIESFDSIPTINVYCHVGWHKISDELFFLHRKAIHQGNCKKSEYHGSLDLSRTCKIENFIDFFENNLSKMIGLQAICAISLSAAVVGRLRDKNHSFIFHIEGGSTTGKTTSLQFAGSLWGNPEIKKDGLVRTWNSTDNGLIKSLCGNCGIPICLDELVMTNASKTSLTYLLTGGNDKQRMTEGSSDEVFRTVFMSTGEIQFKTGNFGGISARLFEVRDYNFTKSKKFADQLNEFYSKNFGIVGYEFVKALSTYSDDQINKKLITFTRKVEKIILNILNQKGLKTNPILGRCAETIAIVALAANIAKKRLGIAFNISGIVSFFIRRTSLLDVCQNEALEAANSFLTFYNNNRSKFPTKSNVDNAGSVFGISVFKKGELEELVILFDNFVKIAKKFGYQDTRTLLKQLKESNLSICEPGKNYCRRKVGNIARTKVVVFNVKAIMGGDDYEA